MENVTFDDILRLKLRREEQGKAQLDIEINSLGKSLRFSSPTRDQQLDFISALRSGGDIAGAYPAYKQLIYDCCPLLHSDEVQKEFGTVNPSDVVDKLFTPLEVIEIGDKLSERFFHLEADIKN